MSVEDRLRRLEDRVELAELRHQYAQTIDDHRWADWADLFTADTTCDYAGWGTFEGRDRVRAAMEEAFAANIRDHRHVFYQPILSIDGDDATGQWYYDVYTAFVGDEDSPYPAGTASLRQGRYFDEYRRVDGEWKFSSVEQTLDTRTQFEYELDETDQFGELITYGPPQSLE